MNARILFKTIFMIILLLLLVLIGLYNKEPVGFSLPPLLPRAVRQPAAIMFFGFFAVGLVTGTILSSGGKRGGGGESRSAKGNK